jgi:hypothetical protein
MTDLTLEFKFTDRGGADVFDVIGERLAGPDYVFGQIRIPPDPKLDEMRQIILYHSVKASEMREEILERDVQIERLQNVDIPDLQRSMKELATGLQVAEIQIKRALGLPDKWDEVYEQFNYLNPSNLRADVLAALEVK